MSSRKPRPADVARLSLAVVLLMRPDDVVHWTASADGKRVRRTVRLLGLRYVAQSAVGLAVHRPWLRAADSAVDVIHAASMLGFAWLYPEHRRMALLSSAAALAFVAADTREQTS